MNNIINDILNLVYPPVCGFCGNIYENYICKKCIVKIKQYEIENKKNYNNKKMYFDEFYSIFKYEGIIRDTLIKYKFQNKAYLYKTFSKIILNNKKICGILKKYDIIIPVPIHKKRKHQRGYNQTELIAREIANNTNLQLENKVLFKQKNVISQSELSKIDRKENIKNAFMIQNIEKIKNKKVIIFDDIYTTGSTVNECARVLKKAGTSFIGVLTFSKD